ncbi:hypothetical protein FOCC_FOCC003087 [Frankliniella occidentalis]|uniref:Uncharacterized protein LOC113214683 isoform X2 n=1 Tax=Frankliniella occidentalis TaxID=133901 RepID=A0A6J1TGG6_FRAOC|nr:uncharacterized protein LOC113214683 isoform X2 [Frankliniella occidentalis]KAE8750279.1 hypothetical protein FOCC_FOCC003087 [Frankliniella occidentalis]
MSAFDRQKQAACRVPEMALSHSDIHHDSDLDTIQDEYERVRGEFERLGFPARLPISIADSGESESWDMMQDVELEEFDFGPSSPPTDLSEGELEEVMLNGGIFNWQQPSISNDIMALEDESESSEIDDELMASRSESSLSGDSDGSPSTISPSALSPVYRDSPDSMGRSDCENHPISPCHSPCYSRPGSPWPMFARPSFKKTRSPFWTTFRVREFR